MRELENRVYTNIMYEQMAKEVRLVSRPTVLDRIRGFLLFIRSIQGRLGKNIERHPQEGGDFVV